MIQGTEVGHKESQHPDAPSKHFKRDGDIIVEAQIVEDGLIKSSALVFNQCTEIIDSPIGPVRVMSLARHSSILQSLLH